MPEETTITDYILLLNNVIDILKIHFLGLLTVQRRKLTMYVKKC